jgi:hypothetical protein
MRAAACCIRRLVLVSDPCAGAGAGVPVPVRVPQCRCGCPQCPQCRCPRASAGARAQCAKRGPREVGMAEPVTVRVCAGARMLSWLWVCA